MCSVTPPSCPWHYSTHTLSPTKKETLKTKRGRNADSNESVIRSYHFLITLRLRESTGDGEDSPRLFLSLMMRLIPPALLLFWKRPLCASTEAAHETSIPLSMENNQSAVQLLKVHFARTRRLKNSINLAGWQQDGAGRTNTSLLTCWPGENLLCQRLSVLLKCHLGPRWPLTSSRAQLTSNLHAFLS